MHVGQTPGPQRRRTRIGINAHLLSGEAGYRRAGIHQYIAQVLRHLPWEEEGPDYVVYTRQTNDIAALPGKTAVSTRLPTERRLFRIAWEQLVWPWQARRRQIDLLHSMAFVTPVLTRIPTVVTVFDLSFMHYPDSFPAAQRRYLTGQTRRSCRHARRIITISESSRQDVHRFFDIPPARIDVVRPGLDPAYHPPTPPQLAAFRAKMGLDRRVVLHVGTLQPRKNIPVLLDAFARLADPALQLVLVGGKGWLFDDIFRRVEALGIAQQVQFTGYVPDAELPLWYAAADLFVFPSVYEGFGMPVVEAMACGTPVIAADTSSIPEATGAAGLLFDPHDAAQLAERMANVLYDDAQSDKMRRLGQQQAQQFSWETAGRETAVVYQKALSDQ